MFQLSLELKAPSFYLWEPPRRFLKEPYKELITVYQYRKIIFLPMEIFTSVSQRWLSVIAKITTVLNSHWLLKIFLKYDWLSQKLSCTAKWSTSYDWEVMEYMLVPRKSLYPFFGLTLSPDNVCPKVDVVYGSRVTLRYGSCLTFSK